MKKQFKDAWLFPNCFLLFLFLFLLVKFLFIFFFRAAYEPAVLFNLTPLYLFSGVSNIQLLSLSLLLMGLDLYLHLRISKRKLLLSFLPTSLMVSGVGFTIMYSPLDVSYVFHYLLFACLMIIVLIDYQYVLKGIEFSGQPHKKEMMPERKLPQEAGIVREKPLFTRFAKQPTQHTATIPPQSINELKNISNTILQRMQLIINDLERKTLQIERLEQKFKDQKPGIAHEPLIASQITPDVTFREKTQEKEKQPIYQLPTEAEILLKEKIENHLVIDDEMNDIVAVVQRGIFKEISNSFASFLGYERAELLQKNFFVFIAPRGYEDTRKYYLNRLKGVTSNSFRTVILTKTHTEMLVEITVTPTIYKGDSAEFLSIKEVKNAS